MSEDPFADPLSAMKEIEELDATSLPDDMPDELKQIIKNIQDKGGVAPTIRSLVMQMGADGKPEIIGEADGKPLDLPQEIMDVITGRATQEITNRAVAGPDPEGLLARLMGKMLDTYESSEDPETLFKNLGWEGTLEEANAFFEDVTKLFMKAGRGVFKESAFKRLYAETDLIESMAFQGQMLFMLGYYLRGNPDSDVPTSSNGAEHPFAEQAGDSGGAGASS